MATNGIINAGDYPSLQAAADVAFGSVGSPHGTANVTANKLLYIPNGIYGPPSAGAPVLDLKYLHGGRIIGAGRFVTKLVQNVEGVAVIRTNGCAYSNFEGFMLEGPANTTLFDLNWDGTAGGAALQSNVFDQLFFYGGDYGINIGAGGFMGSENHFRDCFWLLNAQAGLVTSNFNALQQTITGGNFQTCGKAIWIGVGSVNIVHGVGFQQSVDCDIKTSGSSNNSMSVVGCRSESTNFIHNDASHALTVEACVHTGLGVNGNFVRQIGGLCGIRSSISHFGRVVPTDWTQMTIEDSYFHRTDWIDATGLATFATYTGAVDIRKVFWDDPGGSKLIVNEKWIPVGAAIQKSSADYTVIP